MLTDTILLLSDAIAVKLENDIQHLLQLPYLDVLGGGVTIFELDDFYLLADLVWRAHELLDLLVDSVLLTAEGCQLLVVCMDYFPLDRVTDRCFLPREPLQIR
jgi:hypothetical protein